MNTRHIVTHEVGWFGGGGDLTPMYPNDAKTRHDLPRRAQARLRCRTMPDYYARFKKWCDEYFFLKHRNEPRGVGGIFYDYLDSGDWDKDFAFTRDVGLAFLDVYPQIVRGA